MVPIDSNGFQSSFTPNPDCSHETWKHLLTANGHFSVPQELYQSNQWNGREP